MFKVYFNNPIFELQKYKNQLDFEVTVSNIADSSFKVFIEHYSRP
jgi:hypothetical protein